MSQKAIVKSFAVSGLSGSTTSAYVGDIDFTKAAASIFSTAASGTYDMQASADNLVWTSIIGGAKNTGPGAAVAVGTQFPQTSGSYQFVRLSNVAAGTFAMGGALTGTLVGAPFTPSF